MFSALTTLFNTILGTSADTTISLTAWFEGLWQLLFNSLAWWHNGSESALDMANYTNVLEPSYILAFAFSIAFCVFFVKLLWKFVVSIFEYRR